MPSARHSSEAVDVDCGQVVWRRLKDVAVVVDLNQLAPVGGRPAGGRDRRRFEPLLHMQNKGVRPPYRDYYTPETRDRVAHLFARTIDHFGYVF